MLPTLQDDKRLLPLQLVGTATNQSAGREGAFRLYPTPKTRSREREREIGRERERECSADTGLTVLLRHFFMLSEKCSCWRETVHLLSAVEKHGSSRCACRDFGSLIDQRLWHFWPPPNPRVRTLPHIALWLTWEKTAEDLQIPPLRILLIHLKREDIRDTGWTTAMHSLTLRWLLDSLLVWKRDAERSAEKNLCSPGLEFEESWSWS